MIFRSEESKRDLVRSWNRPDRPFFASGACHVLAAMFLELHQADGYHALHIRPNAGFRGGHVITSNGTTVFDYHGFVPHERYFQHFLAKLRRFFPDWQGTVEKMNESPIEPAFCERNQMRRLDQFPHDPLLRATAYVKRLEARWDGC